MVLTALFTFEALFYLFGWAFELVLLIAVIISSTDAAAVFSLLCRQPSAKTGRGNHSNGIRSQRSDGHPPDAARRGFDGQCPNPLLAKRSRYFFGSLPWLLRWAGQSPWVLSSFSIACAPIERGHYYTLSLALTLLVFGLAQSIHTSGMLAVFVAGLVMGNQAFIHKQGGSNFSTALASVANIGMFILFGLQEFPRE